MKILHVTHEAEGYGIGTLLDGMLRRQLQNKSLQQVGVVFHKAGMKINDYTQQNSLNTHILNVNSAKDIRVFWRSYKILKNYDVIHLHTLSPWIALCAIYSRKKIVYMFHGALGLRNVLKIPVIKLFMKYFFIHKCHFFTFASQSSLQRFTSGFSVMPEHYAVFPYGMDLSSIKASISREQMRENLGLQNFTIIGSAIRIRPEKRPDLLLRAFSKLPCRENCKLVLVGDGDSQYQAYIQKTIEELQLQNQVLLLGYRQDVFNIMNALDIFVLPSEQEPFGLALVEAMLLQIPCIVMADGGGCVDILGKSGLIADDENDLAEKILSLVEDRELATRFAKEGQQRAQQFDISHTVEKFIDIYKKT